MYYIRKKDVRGWAVVHRQSGRELVYTDTCAQARKVVAGFSRDH